MPNHWCKINSKNKKVLISVTVSSMPRAGGITLHRTFDGRAPLLYRSLGTRSPDGIVKRRKPELVR